MFRYSWSDIDEIAISLNEKYPNLNPLDIRFTDLLNYILGLDFFEGKRNEANESKLEAIQMAWYEEWQENQ